MDKQNQIEEMAMDKPFDLLNQGYAIVVKVTINGKPFGGFIKFENELSKEQAIIVVEDMMVNTLRAIEEDEDEEDEE